MGFACLYLPCKPFKPVSATVAVYAVGSSSRSVVRYMRMSNENVQPSPIPSISDSFAVIRTTQENISSNATTEVGRRRTGQMGRPRLRDRPSDLTSEATSTQRRCNGTLD